MRALILALVAVAGVAAAAEPESYRCVGAHAAGFNFDSPRGWYATTFNNRATYVVRRPKGDESPDSAWLVFEDDKDYPIAWCKSEPNDYGWLTCEVGTFVLNVRTLRFSYFSQAASFTSGIELDRGSADSTFTTIGYCRAEPRTR